MSLFYGKAAPFMQEFKTYTEKRMAEMDKPLGTVAPDKRPFLDAAFFTTLNTLLDQAEKAEAGNQAVLNNIKQERLIVDHSYLCLWKTHNNPLGLDKKILQQRISENADIFAANTSLRLGSVTANSRWSSSVTTWTSRKARQNRGHAARWLDFTGRDVVELTAAELDGGFWRRPDAFGGKAKVKDSDASRLPRPTLHLRRLRLEIQQHLSSATLAKKTHPQDEKYHWYYAGASAFIRTDPPLDPLVLDDELHLPQGHAETGTQTTLRRHMSAKLQGPSCVANSKQPDEVRVDRVILVKSTGRKRVDSE